ncbi:MAG TPA: hypothetical protein VEL76_30325, partial [Gemmataceae bacterium]|nr:hypothetical protein [Gemmataceae bacterium]
MILLRALVCLIPCLAQPPREGADVLPEGIYGLTCRVVEVRGQDLIVRVESGGDDGKILSIKTTEVSRFSLLDRDPKPEKTDTVIKPIRRADLKAGQKVGVTIYSDGKEVRLLTCVAAGPNLSGEGVLQHVTDLRGKHKKLRPWLEGNRPVRWDIDLAGTKVNDQDLVVLARLPELEILNLAFTGVTDEGLKRLVPLRRLAEINLIGTGVTDASITTLRQFRELRRIGVAQSKFSPKGIEELLDAFPALDLCRLASGKQGAFRIIEHFHDG